jgi:hypothetical protein
VKTLKKMIPEAAPVNPAEADGSIFIARHRLHFIVPHLMLNAQSGASAAQRDEFGCRHPM